MSKRYVLVLIVVLASIALVYQPLAAKEDTAQIKFKKTAISKKNLYTYTVKKGDILSTIIRKIPGITEKYISNNYKLVRELNPDVPDLDNLEAGQSLILPGKPLTDAEEKEGEKTTISTAKISSTQKAYKIKRGDTLYKIIRRELKITEINIPKTVRAIKSINPRIKNVNKIYVGTLIKLPDKTVFVKTPEEIKPVTQEMASTSEKSVQPEKIIEIKEKKIMPPEARLALLKQIITQMNGTITTSGNYYLPIPKAGQVTIDCSKIPLIEFDDNTIVFLDLENRANTNLKKMISSNWKNYNLVKINNDDDIINILKKVLTTTKNYDIIKSEKPLTIGTRPTVEILVDWLIVKPIPGQQSKSVVQGLRPIYENNLLLPKSVKNYAQKNGLTITEFSEETGIVGKPEELYSLPPIPVFPTTSAKDFSFALVSHLGFSAEKDFEIQLFDTVKDGFNLSLKADVLVNKDNKKYVIYSQPLSQQFINALKQAGHETIFVSDSDSPKNIMGNVLSGLDIPFTYENFTFSGPEKNQAPYALKFSGTKINQDLYVVDFDIDSELRGLLQEVWSAKIDRY
jgi:LysM repeat protein